MILLELFLTFMKIGLFTVGGGYAMLPMIRYEVIANGWLSESMLIDFIAISESTPGSFVINLATFIGNSQAGILGGIIATLGVILPSIIIIMLISRAYEKFSENKLVKNALYGIRPVVVGLICSAFFSVLMVIIFPTFDIGNINIEFFKSFDYISLIIFIFIFGLSLIKMKKKSIHPILLIIISALIGIVVFGVFKL